MPTSPAKTPTKKKKKTTAKTTALRIQPHGGALRDGGTNKGGPGRPPDAFKQLCRDLASGDLTVTNVEAILHNKDHPQFMAALRWATEHGYGKATEVVEISGKDGGPIQTESFEWAGLTLKLVI